MSAEEKNFEESLKQLENIVEKMEQSDAGLDANIKAFEDGTKLVKFCSNYLEKAEKKVEILIQKADGKGEWEDVNQPDSDLLETEDEVEENILDDGSDDEMFDTPEKDDLLF